MVSASTTPARPTQATRPPNPWKNPNIFHLSVHALGDIVARVQDLPGAALPSRLGLQPELGISKWQILVMPGQVVINGSAGNADAYCVW